jgi:site-specific DNA recombinase
MNLIGYVRVSRTAGRAGESFTSPTTQRRRIKAAAAAQGHTVIEWVEEFDQSGGREDRPKFQAALKAVENREADGIAVAYLSRFARSVSGAARALERIEAADGILVAADLGMDTSTSTGRLMRTVLFALAEFELDQIRETTQASRENAIERGVHICRVPTTGYERGEGKRLELDPVAAPVVRELFRLKAVGATWSALCAFMDERLPRPNGTHWTRSTLAGIIASRTYLGEAFAGDVVKRGAHPELVDRATWEAAQSSGKRPQRRAGAALLQGLARCAACGHTLTRMSDGKRGYMNYECRKRHSGGICAEPTKMSVRRLDDHVEEAFLEWLEREQIAVEATASTDDEVVALVEAVEAAEVELREYRDAQLISLIGRDAFAEGLEQRQRRLEEARAELEQARRATIALPIGPQKLIDLWPDLSTDEKHAFLSAAIDAVAVRRADLPGKGSSVPARVHIFWRGQAPVDLPGRGSLAIRSLDWRPNESGLAAAH